MVGKLLKGKIVLHFIVSRGKISLMMGCYKKTDLRKVKFKPQNGTGFLNIFLWQKLLYLSGKMRWCCNNNTKVHRLQTISFMLYIHQGLAWLLWLCESPWLMEQPQSWLLLILLVEGKGMSYGGFWMDN